MQNAFEILIPTLESRMKKDLKSSQEMENKEESLSEFLKLLEAPESPVQATVHDVVDELGLGSVNYELQIQVGPPIQTTDNELLLKVVQEHYKILRLKSLKKIHKWLKLLTKLEQNQEQEQIIKQLLDLKSEVGEIESQCIKLGITPEMIEKDQIWVSKQTSFVVLFSNCIHFLG